MLKKNIYISNYVCSRKINYLIKFQVIFLLLLVHYFCLLNDLFFQLLYLFYLYHNIIT
jgi:hypothetical protein